MRRCCRVAPQSCSLSVPRSSRRRCVSVAVGAPFAPAWEGRVWPVCKAVDRNREVRTAATVQSSKQLRARGEEEVRGARKEVEMEQVADKHTIQYSTVLRGRTPDRIHIHRHGGTGSGISHYYSTSRYRDESILARPEQRRMEHYGADQPDQLQLDVPAFPAFPPAAPARAPSSLRANPRPIRQESQMHSPATRRRGSAAVRTTATAFAWPSRRTLATQSRVTRQPGRCTVQYRTVLGPCGGSRRRDEGGRG